MKKLILLVAIVCANTHNVFGGNTIKDIFSAMPDSIMPYLSANNKLDMLDFMANNDKAIVTNKLEGTTELEKLTANYLKLKMNEAKTVELVLLKSKPAHNSTNNVLCVIETLGRDTLESKITFYSEKWQVLDIKDPIQEYAKALVTRPDSIDSDTYGDLLKLTQNMMARAIFSNADNTILLEATFPMLSSEDKQRVACIIKPISLKWDSTGFNKY